MLESLSLPATLPAGWGMPSADHGMRMADPTALAALVTPDLPRAQVPGSLCWLTFLMTLFYWNVPLSVLGRWCGVHKTTILRWVVGLALALGPRIAQWIGERVQAQRVYVDEKWLKIRGRWQYWFVVLDGPTELPVLAALLPSRSQWACRWIGRQLPRLFKEQGLAVLSIDPVQVFVHYALAELFLGAHLAQLQASGTLSPGQARQWWEHLQHADKHLTLLISFTTFIAVGTRN